MVDLFLGEKIKKNDQKLSELTVNYAIKLLNKKNILSKKKKRKKKSSTVGKTFSNIFF